MERTWKPTTAGILSIIAGTLSLIACIWCLMFTYPMIYGLDLAEKWDEIAQILGVVGVVFINLGVISILGGIFALKRRLWGLALAGAICALGILSSIFVAMGKGEFSQVISSDPEAGV
jgi:hypothetical protein